MIGSTAEETSQMLFANYMEEWLEMIKMDIRQNTYGDYQRNIMQIILTYFRKKELQLTD